MNQKSFNDILNYRRSTRKYDPQKPINQNIVKDCVKKATLAPNSSNMQLWEFHHVVHPNLLKIVLTKVQQPLPNKC